MNRPIGHTKSWSYRMKRAHKRVSLSVRELVAAAVLTMTGFAAVPAYADDGDGNDDTLIDLLIDWIDDFFDPEDPEEVLPSDGDGW